MNQKVATGIQGLDELLDGGLPEGRTVLVIGGPGTGKTILAAQFLYNGIRKNKSNGIFVSLDENKNHFFSEMQNFGWDFQGAEQRREFTFIDATRISRVAKLKEKLYKEEATSLRGKELSIERLVEEIQGKIKATGAKRIAVDTLAALFHRFVDPVERRNAIVDLIESISDLGSTNIITTELGHLGAVERTALDEEYLVHGVVMMQTLFSGGTTTRAIQVEKMRGVSVSPNLVPYSIGKSGIEVFPNMQLFGER